MDYPYVILLLLLLVLSYLEWERPSNSLTYFKIAASIVFVFVAFRAPVVGADTWDYYRYATNIRDHYNSDSRPLEPLYLVYNGFFRLYCPVGIIFMIVNTIIIFSPIYHILNKDVIRFKTFGVLSFFLFLNFSIYFIALRQVIALSLVLWGYIFVYENRKNKWKYFFLFAVIGYFFHTTAFIVAVIYIVAYFLPIKKKLYFFAIIIGSALIGIVLKSFNVFQAFDLLLSADIGATDRLNNYLVNKSLNDEFGLNLELRRSMVALFIYYYLKEEEINKWYSKIYLIGVVLNNLFISVPMVNRITISYLLFIIVLFPNAISQIRNLRQKARNIGKYVTLLLIIYFSRSFVIAQSDYDIRSTAKMHPYYFFFEDYRNHPSIIYS